MKVNRADAWQLLSEFTASESLRKHALAVEAAMRWYARHYSEDEELWGVTGLLHDFDYEKYPEGKEGSHPYVGCEILKKLSYPAEITNAIMGHATYTGVARETLLAKTLFACDELCGFVTACVLVRPDKSIHSLEVKSVKKRMKDKAFARGVNREDIALGVKELGIDLDSHIKNVIEAMASISGDLGLDGKMVANG